MLKAYVYESWIADYYWNKTPYPVTLILASNKINADRIAGKIMNSPKFVAEYELKEGLEFSLREKCIYYN